MSDDYLPTGTVAHRRFDHAKRQAFVESVTALMRSRQDDLLSFDDVQKKLGLRITRERGLQQVPLDKIVGSVGKYREFTRSFWPKQEKLRERWKWIYVAAHSFHGLPPVELYQVGEVFFVKDGNHRISVARELGNRSVEAYVTEFLSPVPLTVETVDSNLDEIVLQLEREDFLQRTRILELRPQADIQVTAIGDYRILQEHIAVPGYVVGHDEGRQVSWEEAVDIWYDDVYLPVVRMIHQYELQRHYPGHTDADLYLWLMEQRGQLAQGPEPEKALAAAARQFVEKYNPRLRWVLETRSTPGQWREGRVLPRGDDQLFADILLSLDETPAAWQAVEDILPVAKRERGRLHGLFAGQSLDDHGRADALLQRFAQRCDESQVPWKFREEIGPARRATSTPIPAATIWSCCAKDHGGSSPAGRDAGDANPGRDQAGGLSGASAFGTEAEAQPSVAGLRRQPVRRGGVVCGRTPGSGMGRCTDRGHRGGKPTHQLGDVGRRPRLLEAERNQRTRLLQGRRPGRNNPQNGQRAGL